MRNHNTIAPLEVGWRVVTFMALAVITAAVIFLVINLRGFDRSYQIVMSVLLAISYLTILSGFLLVILGKAKTKLLRRSVFFVISLVLVALIRVAWSVWQDISGVNCFGFFGDITPCIDNAWLQIAIILLLPPGFATVTLATSFLMTAGLVAESRIKQPKRLQH